MGHLTLYTIGETRFFKRTLKFNEVEVTYDDPKFEVPVEINMKNREAFAHLQITESGAELKVYEGMRDPSGSIVGDETGLRTESVQFIEDEHCNRVPASNMTAVLDLISGSDEGNGKGGYERGREIGMNNDKAMM